MTRLLFEKTGKSIWISHLDLMRLFQRAFQRAGLHLKHTQGFNPRPSVSIALPLSVGTSSRCELLDFELEGDAILPEEILTRLNKVLVDGIKVVSAYESERKLKDLALLSCQLFLEYDTVITDAKDRIEELFRTNSLIVEKRTKNGPVEQDIIPLIKNLTLEAVNDHCVCIHAVICCQNPSLNPSQIISAIERYLPDCRPDHAQIERLEIMDEHLNTFR